MESPPSKRAITFSISTQRIGDDRVIYQRPKGTDAVLANLWQYSTGTVASTAGICHGLWSIRSPAIYGLVVIVAAWKLGFFHPINGG